MVHCIVGHALRVGGWVATDKSFSGRLQSHPLQDAAQCPANLVKGIHNFCKSIVKFYYFSKHLIVFLEDEHCLLR